MYLDQYFKILINCLGIRQDALYCMLSNDIQQYLDTLVAPELKISK